MRPGFAPGAARYSRIEAGDRSTRSTCGAPFATPPIASAVLPCKSACNGSATSAARQPTALGGSSSPAAKRASSSGVRGSSRAIRSSAARGEQQRRREIVLGRDRIDEDGEARDDRLAIRTGRADGLVRQFRFRERETALHGLDDPVAVDLAGPGVEPAELREILAGRGPQMDDRGHHVFGDDVFERHVAIARETVAQDRDLAQDAEFAPIHPHRPGDAQIEALRVDCVTLRIDERAGFFFEPGEAPAPDEPFAQAILQREEVADVVDEVLDLLRRERPRAPIADRLRFAQPHAGDVLHEIRKRDRHPVSAERRSELRIERARGQAIEAIGEDLEIALQRMPDDRPARQGVGERLQRRKPQRIDQRHFVVEGELHDHQARRVRALVVKFRIERDALRACDPFAQLCEGFFFIDQLDVHGPTGIDLTSRSWSVSEARSPKIASAVQIGIAIADIVKMWMRIGTRIAAAVCVAIVPPSPGMMRTTIKNIGEPIL